MINRVSNIRKRAELVYSATRFKGLLNAASNRSKKRISMYFHVKATRTNKGGEGIVSVNQTFYVMLDETLDSGVSQI